VPNTAEHIRQAEHNEALAARCTQNFPDWAMTALFYAALHWAEAYFYADRPSGKPDGYITHDERSAAVLDRISQEAYTQYRYLEDQSRNARYRCTRFSKADIAIVQRDYYAPFRDTVRARLPQ